MFDRIAVDTIGIRHDIAKFVRLTNFKVIVHVLEKGLKDMRYKNRKHTAQRTINLLVTNEQGNQHYCDKPKLNRLYHYTCKNHCMDHMCERLTQALKTEETQQTFRVDICVLCMLMLNVIFSRTLKSNFEQRLGCMMSGMKYILVGISTSRGMMRIVAQFLSDLERMVRYQHECFNLTRRQIIAPHNIMTSTIALPV